MTGLSLSAHGVSHRYGGTHALEDVTLTAEPGRVLALLGPSGCGKSTLLGILGGLLRPTAGEVRMAGAAPPGCLNPLTYVFQDFALLPWRSVERNVSLPLEGRVPRAERRERVAAALAACGLSEFARAWPRQLSGGMRQRVGIARALAVRPACLLLDEPLSALDGPTRTLLLDEFARLIEETGVTAVYVTHALSEAVRLGHQVAVLSRRPGRVREVLSLDRPLAGRRPEDPDLLAAEARLWALMRADAAAADREAADAA